MSKLFGFDLEKLLTSGAFFKSAGTRQLWLVLIALNIVTFFVFFSQHLLHNHGARMPWIAPNDALQHGRWFNIYLLRLTNAADIPALLPLIAMFLNVSSAMMLLSLWSFDLSKLEKFLVGGLLTTFPAFLSFYYFSWVTVLFTIGGFFAVLSVYACRRFRILDIILGSISVLLMMAAYQPNLSVFATIVAACAIADLVRRDASEISEIMSTVLARGLAGIIGGAAYFASVIYTNASSHATKTIQLSDIPERIILVINKSIEHLTISQPELPASMKTMLLVLLFISILSSLFLARSKIGRIGLVILFWMGAIVGTKAMFVISADANFFQYRYNTSMAFLHAFTAAILLHTFSVRLFKSVAIVGVAFVLLRFVQADLVRQEVLLRGQQHDLATANRILTRIESLPDLDVAKKYDLIRVGSYPHFRNTIYRSRGHSWDVRGDGHMDDARITARWADEDVFKLLGSSVKFQHYGFDPKFIQKERDIRERLLGDRKPWPHRDSVFIDDDKIIVYLQ